MRGFAVSQSVSMDQWACCDCFMLLLYEYRYSGRILQCTLQTSMIRHVIRSGDSPRSGLDLLHDTEHALPATEVHSDE